MAQRRSFQWCGSRATLAAEPAVAAGGQAPSLRSVACPQLNGKIVRRLRRVRVCLAVMELKLTIPTKAQILGGGFVVAVAAAGSSWSRAQLGAYARRKGV